MAGMPSKYQHLRTRLRLEQTRLLSWGEKVGLVEELLEQPSRTLSMNRNLIIDVLLEIQTTFKSVVKVTTIYDQYGEPTPTKDPNSPQISILRRTLEHLEKPSKLVARLEWAMIKQDRFEELIVRLIEFNNRIESFLDRSTLDELRINQERSNLLLLQVTEQLGQLQVLVDAVQFNRRSEKTSGISRSPTLVETEATVDSPFADLVKFKLQQMVTGAQMEDVQMLPLSPDLLFPKGVPASENRSKTQLYGKSLWVEWSEPVPESPAIPQLARIFEDRVAKLALLLSSPNRPSAFRGPTCLGYLRQEDDDMGLRFGLVYEASPSAAEKGGETQITSLRELLHTRKPSLTRRASLARKVTESLMYLHAVNWLHKGFRSDSILFCSPAAISRKAPELGGPVVSGFEFSRPDLPTEVTVKTATRLEHDLYRHPDLVRYSELRSQKSHDIYSLGLVLLEVGFWQPIEQLVGISLAQKGVRGKLLQVRELLLATPFRHYTNLREALAAEMGDEFAEAARRCLQGGLDIGIPTGADEADPEIGARIQQAFHDEVVMRL